jgi:hypothetical protein
VVRYPANELQPDSDLGTRLVTRDVGRLSDHEIADALEAGASRARQLLMEGLIEGAVLRLFDKALVVGTMGIETRTSQAGHEGAIHRLMHA